jgi:recombination protein RecT
MAAVTTRRTGEIVRDNQQQQQQGGQISLAGFVLKHQDDFARVLPKHMTPERMVRLAVSAVRTTRHLDKCTLPSFASAIMACSTLGLEPNTPLGHAYLIPFKNNRRGGIYECQLIVGYKGLVELMYRSGIVASVKCTPVFEGDLFEYEFGLHPDIRHKPGSDPKRFDPRKLTHVYPVVKLREQGLDPIWDVLTRDQIEQRRRRSKASGDGPWVTDYIAMALKTGVRSIATWVPSSSERIAPLAQAVAYEEALERGRHGQAIAALGDAAQETLHQLGAFPQEDEPEAIEAAGEETAEEVPTREPGDDSDEFADN